MMGMQEKYWDKAVELVERGGYIKLLKFLEKEEQTVKSIKRHVRKYIEPYLDGLFELGVVYQIIDGDKVSYSLTTGFGQNLLSYARRGDGLSVNKL